MNETVYFDPACDDDERRRRLFGGQLFVYSPRPSSLAFCEFTRALVEDAFKPLDPRSAQHQMPVEEYAQLLARLKPAFINHQESKAHIQRILSELACDLTKTHFDVPRLRSSTSHGYLTHGIAYAWHPHRDTWYSAPPCQINLWIPIYEISAENALAFHPRYFRQAVPNTSAEYNYYHWNQEHRGHHVAQLISSDPRPLPKPKQPIELDSQIRLVVTPGAIIMFSAAQLHSSVPNTSGVTRFSVDFRVVNIDDASAGRGATNLDAECTGTTMRDYLRATDLTRMPDRIIQMYDDESAQHGRQLYQPTYS